MGEHQDFLEEEKQNLPPIEQLRNVYRAGQQDARSLARIRQRLLAGEYVPASTILQKPYDDYKQQKNVKRMNTMDPQIHITKTPKLSTHRRGLIALAAVLSLILIISTAVISQRLLGSQGPHIGATPAVVSTQSTVTSTVTPNATVKPTVTATVTPVLPHISTQVSNIHMVNSTTGWILCLDGSVLRTTDGGLNWLDVTPAALFSFNQEHSEEGSLFLDGSTAWIVVLGNTNTSVSFHTSDAGQTWQEGTFRTDETLATAGPSYTISANSPLEAWTLETQAAGTSLNDTHWMTRLSHTTDGGQTWTQVQNLPTIGLSSSSPTLSFANQQTVILTGGTTVFLTRDGGANWQSIPVLSPDPSHWKLMGLSFSQFLTPNDGIITAMYQSTTTEGVTGIPDGEGFSIFSTHDGAQTWTSSPVVNIGVVGGANGTTFFNAQQGYVLASVGQVGGLQAYTTSDGGQHWNATALNLPDQTSGRRAASLDFTSLTVGWALLASQGHAAQPFPTSLYTTVDGGQTWTQVHAHFPSFITPQATY